MKRFKGRRTRLMSLIGDQIIEGKTFMTFLNVLSIEKINEEFFGSASFAFNIEIIDIISCYILAD